MSSEKFQRQYYFAFGSNMHLTQMAERCPGSTFIGKATLRGYRWQINQRHVANIVKVAEDFSGIPAEQVDVVEGLVFSITDKDRRILDRKEGIKLGVYERVELNVLLERHPHFADNKTAYVRDRLHDQSDAIDRPASYEETHVESQQKDHPMPDGTGIGESVGYAQSKSSVLPKKPPPSVEDPPAANIENIGAITYLSTKYTDNGLIRLEYVQRMENAISDAVKLGMSRDFVEKCLEPYVHGEVYQPEENVEEKPSSSDAAITQAALEERNRKADEERSKKAKSRSAGQLPDQAQRAPQTKKKMHGRNLKKKPLQGKVRQSYPQTGEGGEASGKEEDKGSTGFWSSVSSMFGSGQSQGSAKTPQDR
ncbi:hypothetical protein TCE0_041r13990 [Talaromyces pinophilus]|uniref:gamma-glutamylcyclotransferase n=1 Tax=Talaromyces pinophilus TaxID=128442 RepID=A0A6V8HND2_TALPI|nr:hypothetical protein TCE0_041r13990 [Talaromyces pinophilus]